MVGCDLDIDLLLEGKKFFNSVMIIEGFKFSNVGQHEMVAKTCFVGHRQNLIAT